ncbi:MAG: protein tyrosine phosphatase family protein [Armatimonadetes bacterium]|nr:protein tyrosine phosphatase family protein [Armatimonadota bacterium]
MASTDIYNYVKVNDALITGGQPTAEQIRSLAEEGFSTVINLDTADSARALAGEAELVRSLGMTYHHIPVDWRNPTEADFAAFARVMSDLPAGKTLIHCAANFRVTAFYSLYALERLGWSAARADEFRAVIWKGSDHPGWQEFIARMEARILARRSGGAPAVEEAPSEPGRAA